MGYGSAKNGQKIGQKMGYAVHFTQPINPFPILFFLAELNSRVGGGSEL
jgi:hypothetical protein